jgi:hypothetical protein
VFELYSHGEDRMSSSRSPQYISADIWLRAERHPRC